MDYIHLRGEYDDVPLDEMLAFFTDSYGGVSFAVGDARFDDDVDREQAAG